MKQILLALILGVSATTLALAATEAVKPTPHKAMVKKQKAKKKLKTPAKAEQGRPAPSQELTKPAGQSSP